MEALTAPAAAETGDGRTARGAKASINTSTPPRAASPATSSTAGAVVAAPPPPPTYYRLVVDGVEDDSGDYGKCAELIASVLEARLAYKSIDKGQREDPISVEEVNCLAMVAPDSSGDGAGATANPASANDAATASSATGGAEVSHGDDVVEDEDKDRPANIPPIAAMKATPAPLPPSSLMRLSFEDGIYRVQGMRTKLVPWQTYVADIQRLYQAIESGPCLSTARARLTSLSSKFQLYTLMNGELEMSSGANGGYGGAYVRCTKVDNALHMKTSMPAPVLLEFIARAAKEQPNVPLLDIAESDAILVAAGLARPTDKQKPRKNARKTRNDGPSRDSTVTVPVDRRKSSSSHGDGTGVLSRRGSLAAAAKHCISLRQYLQAAGVSDPTVLTVEGLGLHPTLYRNKFLPYDMLSSQSNPAGPFGAKLLQAVLSTDNEGPNRGDLCGSLIRAELEKREFKPRQAVVTEMLLDVGGINEFEVTSLAAWTRRQGFNSFTANMWVLNIVPHFRKGFDGEGCAASAAAPPPASQPSATPAALAAKPLPFSATMPAGASVTAPPPTNRMIPTCRTVGQQLRNIFYPLFMATLYPTDPHWSDVAQLLMNTGSVSIQTSATSRTQNLFTSPVHPDSIRISLTGPKRNPATAAATTTTTSATAAVSPALGVSSAASSGGKEVSDFYFFYYAWANLASLNCLRARFGLNTLHFNPSIQEQAPAYDQLACSFLLADNVYHATSLSKCWIMQYLYMYARIGLVMSPLRDNALNVSFFDHPIVRYFQQGLQVSLSTSAPLHFHHRVDQPLLEEYSSLLKLCSLSSMDLCEIARNSVLNSNYPEHMKRKWLGELYTLIGCSGNDMARSCVCDARLQFRCESLAQEEAVLNRVLAKSAEGKSKPGAAVTPKVITIIAEASSPLRLVAVPATDRNESHKGSFVASALVVRGDGEGQPVILGTAAAAAAAATRRLQAIASTPMLATPEEGADSEGKVTGLFREQSSRGSRCLSMSPSQPPCSARRAHSDPNDSCVDRRVAFPRIKISYGNGLDGGCGVDGAGSLFAEGDDNAAARPASGAGPSTKVAKSGYTTVASLRRVLLLRAKYLKVHATDVNVEDVFSPANQLDEDMWEFNSYYGVVLLSRAGKSASWPSSIPPLQEFIRDLETVRQAASSATLLRLAAHRLSLLEKKFQLHLSMNISKEGGARSEKEWNNRDFFTAHKVDTNVQMAAGHNAHTLLEFVVDKAVNHGEDVVGEDAELNPVTLRMLLQHYKVRVETMTVDELHHLLGTHEDLHRTFLSPHNYMQGRYFAELSKRTLSLYQEDAYSFAENRLPFEGGSQEEWRLLSHWFDRYGMASSQSRWMVNIPREYNKLRANGDVSDFGEFLDNVFLPLWEISLHPAKDTKLHYFLTHVSGFDCTANEECTVDAPLSAVHPHDWRSDTNPPYNYYLYYLWANITSLNEFRASRGLSTFSFRPQCGELGGLEHLIGGYLVANGINHGVTLAKHPVLEYIFYLTQIGIAMSPLSNTAAASAYLENPFPVYFQRGLNVSLATNTPLYFHFTREPLIEEYSIAAKLWQLEFNDLSEIARNSVLQCGFPPAWKARALGQLYQLSSTLGNDVRRSRLSDIRVAFRYECYHTELNFLDAQLLQSGSATAATAAGSADATTNSGNQAPLTLTGSRGQQLMPRAMKTLEEEMFIYRAFMRTAWSNSCDKGVKSFRQQSFASRHSTPATNAIVTGGDGTGIPSSQQLARLLSHSARDGLEDREESSFSDLDDVHDFSTVSDEMACYMGASNGSCGGSTSHIISGEGFFSPGLSREERRRQRRLVRQQQRELDRLEAELRQLATVSQQLSTENSAVATMICQMRERLASEGLAILGGLVSTKPAVADPSSSDKAEPE